MRKVTITDLDGNQLGSITELDDGTLQGEGKGQSLIEQAPGKTFDDWMEANHHSKYLRYVEEAA
jgi:hypothetical protein